MYRPRSFFDELGDVEIIEKDGELHLFHLTLPNRDLVGHAVSKDGLSWKALPVAIRTGDPGDCDDDMIRTMSVTLHDDVYHMLYTAASRAEGGRKERVALALSKDLIHWEKYEGNPIGEANETYYETKADLTHRSFWRDPKPYFENGTYYSVVCGRLNQGPFLRRGCVALTTSQDLIHWEVKEPLFAPTQCFNLECPQLYKINDYYYLFASTMEDNVQRYWVSKKIEGPYITPGDNRLLPQNGHYAGRVGEFKGKHIFGCWTKSIEDGPSPFGLKSDRGKVVKYVPSPLEIKQLTNGRLDLISFDGWDRYALTQPKPLDTAGYKFINGNQNARFNTDTFRLNVESGMEIMAVPNETENFKLDGTLNLNASRGGLAFNLDDESAGYFLEFIPEEGRVKLIRHLKSKIPDDNYWFDYSVLQENTLNMNSEEERSIPFSLRVVSGEIEFSVNEKVLISTVSVAKRKGYIGLYADCGQISLENPVVTKMRVPTNE